MRVCVQTRTHQWEQTVAVLCDCKIHTFISKSALHTTSEWKILSCLLHSSQGMTLIKKSRSGLDDKFSHQFPKTTISLRFDTDSSVRPFVRSSRPDVDFVVSRSCFLLPAGACFLFFAEYYFWLQHRQRAFHIHKTLSQTNERTQKHFFGDCLLIFPVTVTTQLTTRE